MRRFSYSFVLLLSLTPVLGACGDDADPGCRDNPTGDACVQFCMENPADPLCTGDAGDAGGTDTGTDTGTDAGDTDTGTPDTGTRDTSVPDGSGCTIACAAPTPFCDEAGTEGPAGECVECLMDSDCMGDRPHCVGGACVPCTPETQDDDCDASAPVCGADGRCSRCNTAADCAGYPLLASCAPGGACVQCIFDDQCTDPGAARCDLTEGSETLNTCVPCTDFSQCADILVDGDPVPACVLEGDDAGMCVQCISDADCDRTTCDVVAYTCR